LGIAHLKSCTLIRNLRARETFRGINTGHATLANGSFASKAAVHHPTRVLSKLLQSLTSGSGTKCACRRVLSMTVIE
jgi:hypothetical protein